MLTFINIVQLYQQVNASFFFMINTVTYYLTVLSPSEGPPPGNPKVPDASGGIPIPKVIQAVQVGNSALPPALQVVTTSVLDQGKSQNYGF